MISRDQYNGNERNKAEPDRGKLDHHTVSTKSHPILGLSGARMVLHSGAREPASKTLHHLSLLWTVPGRGGAKQLSPAEDQFRRC